MDIYSKIYIDLLEHKSKLGSHHFFVFYNLIVELKYKSTLAESEWIIVGQLFKQEKDFLKETFSTLHAAIVKCRKHIAETRISVGRREIEEYAQGKTSGYTFDIVKVDTMLRDYLSNNKSYELMITSLDTIVGIMLELIEFHKKEINIEEALLLGQGRDSTKKYKDALLNSSLDDLLGSSLDDFLGSFLQLTEKLNCVESFVRDVIDAGKIKQKVNNNLIHSLSKI